MQSYEKILSYISQAEEFIPYLIFVMVGLAAYEFFSKKDFKAVIISIGIFGTFLGILIGLYGFDTEDITGSVPKLLEGLKIAFITSVVGMLLSVILSLIEKFSQSHNSDDIQSILKEQLAQSKSTNHIIVKIREDMMQMAQAQSNNLKIINESLKTAVEKMSEGATKEIIKALEEVMRDFNNNLTEQFGDNFKRLNEAVFNLVEWQENYKLHVEQFEKSIKTATEILTKNTNQAEGLTTHFEKLSDTSKSLTSVIETNQNQIQNLEIHMNSLKKLGEEAHMIIASMDGFSKTMQTSIANQSEGLKRVGDRLNEDVSSTINQLSGSLGNLNSALTSLTDKFRNDYEHFLATIKELQRR